MSDAEISPKIPKWACRQYGGYEHDWMDCPDCCRGYEAELEREETETMGMGTETDKGCRAWVVDTKTIIDGRCQLLKTFVGRDASDAERQAAEYISTLPDHLSGRYGLDVEREEE